MANRLPKEIKGKKMSRAKTFTQAELDAAKKKLQDLPDLSKDKIGQADALQELKVQIIALSSSKGYSVAEIKSALESVGVSVTAKSITDLIAVNSKKRSTPAKPSKG